MCSHLESVKLDEIFIGHKTCACIKLRYLVRSGGPNFIPSVRGPVRKIYTTPSTLLFYMAHNVIIVTETVVLVLQWFVHRAKLVSECM